MTEVDKRPKGYEEPGTCRNCRYVVKEENECYTTYYCNRDRSDVPLEGSWHDAAKHPDAVALRGDRELLGDAGAAERDKWSELVDKIYDQMIDARTAWESGRRVRCYGRCPEWEPEA